MEGIGFGVWLMPHAGLRVCDLADAHAGLTDWAVPYAGCIFICLIQATDSS